MRLRHLSNKEIKELPEQELIDLIRHNRYIVEELNTLVPAYELEYENSKRKLEELLDKWAKYNSSTSEEVKSAYLDYDRNKSMLRKCSKELERVHQYRQQLSEELSIRMHGE